MTDDETKRLAQVEQMTRDMHRAFLEPGPDGAPPMLTRMSTLVIAAERGEWMARWSIRVILTLGAIAAAFAAVRALVLPR